MSYRIVDWSEKQHYKDRNPPWIKLHRKILTSYKYSRLSIASKALAPLLWVLASESDDIKSGIITSDVNELSFKVHIDKDTIEKSVNELIENGFIEVVACCNQDASKLRQNSPPETETETETETEAVSPFEASITFEDFWQNYPKQTRRGFALEAYRKSLSITDHKTIMAGLDGYVFPKEQKFCPKPEDWLRGECWIEGLKNNTANQTLTEDQMREDYFKKNGKWLSIWGDIPEHLKKAV